MAQYFISDLHLSENEPKLLHYLQCFFEHQLKPYDQLYILGDLFEVWIGDDDDNVFNEHVKAILKQLSANNVELFIMHGNRDFLLGQNFARSIGAALVKDPTIIQMDGEPVLLMHGDTLCTDDVDYQAYRKKIRNSWVLGILRHLPLSLRRYLANRLRSHTKGAVSKKAEAIMDVNQEAVEQAFEEYGVIKMIHGHTHRPDIHIHEVNGHPSKRIVLSAWESDAPIFYYSSSSESLCELKLD